MQSEFNNLQKWFHANKLSINAEKMKICIYYSKRSRLKNDPIEICIRNDKLEEVDTIKYLGVNIIPQISVQKWGVQKCQNTARVQLNSFLLACTSPLRNEGLGKCK